MEISQNGEKEYDTWILLSRVYHMIAKLRRLELAKYKYSAGTSLHIINIEFPRRRNFPDRISQICL